VIPTLTAIAAKLGVAVAIVPLALAGLFTGFVLLAQCAARWFEDRNP
jgi:hypothetical protein